MTGVFVVVGLVATALVFFVIFCFRRRRTGRQRDRDATVAQTLADFGFRRQVLIESEDHLPANGPRTVTTPTGSGNSADVGRTSSPNMSLSGINPVPVSAGGFNWNTHNPPYLPDGFAQTSYKNPYTNNQAPHRHAYPGPSDSGGIPNFSVPSGSGAGLPFFGHSPQDSTGSSEPLLGANSGVGTSPEPAIPSVPPRNPLRLMGGAEDTPDDVFGRVIGRSLNDENTGYRYDDDVEDGGALRKGSLKVRSGVVDPVYLPNCSRPILGSKQPGLVLLPQTISRMRRLACLPMDRLLNHYL